MLIKIAARKSDLARLQAYQVGKALKEKNPEISIQYQFRESLGDKNLTDPLWKIPEKGVFTEDFMRDLLNGDADLVVHSWKDLPTDEKQETFIAATLPRADQRDLLLMKKSANGLGDLQIFSSSPRREYNLTTLLPQLLPWKTNLIQFQSVRGNIQTRIKKLMNENTVHGLVLAKAALDRLLTFNDLEFSEEFKQTQDFLNACLTDLNWMVLPLSENPTAAAQGAIAIEIRRDRKDLIDLLAKINDKDTFHAASYERKLLKNYGGGCHLALGMSHLKDRNYDVTFLKGKTPQGNVVHEKYLNHLNQKELPKFKPNELWSIQTEFISRQKNVLIESLDISCGYIVSRLDAWPKELLSDSNKYKIWTSGVSTWKKMAEIGVWVYGTFDSFGDQQNPQTEAFWGRIVWKTLTHARHPFLDSKKHIATYEISFNDFGIDKQKFFYWRSSSQFLEALSQFPEILEAYHACGPGSTLLTLRDHIPSDKVYIYLNEQNWRMQCQTEYLIKNT
ncbi:MAG: hydroxymethylbilane synthase [Pseudobdellovibrio sp.]